MNKNITTIVLIIIFAAAGFFGGMQYQKSQRGAGFGNGQNGGFVRRFGQNGQNGQAVRGQILSVDSTGITVKLSDGSTKIVVVPTSAMIGKTTTGTKTDLTQGSNVTVFGTNNSDGSVTAQFVQIGQLLRSSDAPKAQ